MTSVLYRNGRVRSPADPFATALLVDGGTVAWVGSEGAADAMSADAVVDLDDAWLAPAFVDAHVHATTTGLSLVGLDLSDAPSLAVVLDRVSQAARAARGGVVLGTGWEEDRWPERRPPTAAELDRASWGGVVYLARADCHSAVASSALLAAAPEARGLPGWVGEGLVNEQPLRRAPGRLRRADARAAPRRAAGHPRPRRRARDRLPARVRRPAHRRRGRLRLAAGAGPRGAGPGVLGYWGELAAEGGIERARALGAVGAGGDLFADGSIGSRTACLHERYTDADTTGYAYVDAAQVAAHVAACTRAGPAGRLPRHRRRGPHGGAGRVRRRRRGGRRRRAAGRAPPGRARRGPAARGTCSAGRARPDRQRAAGLRDAVGRHGRAVRRAARTGPHPRLEPARGAGRGRRPAGLRLRRPGHPAGPVGRRAGRRAAPTPGSRLSARAAFTAHTRGGWRAARVDGTGELAPGAPATFAVWQLAGELVVQAPDDRVAAWSTDPRAGVAGLPDLDAPDPVCLRTVVDGVEVFRATEGPAVQGTGRRRRRRTPSDLRRRTKAQVRGVLTAPAVTSRVRLAAPVHPPAGARAPVDNGQAAAPSRRAVGPKGRRAPAGGLPGAPRPTRRIGQDGAGEHPGGVQPAAGPAARAAAAERPAGRPSSSRAVASCAWSAASPPASCCTSPSRPSTCPARPAGGRAAGARLPRGERRGSAPLSACCTGWRCSCRSSSGRRTIAGPLALVALALLQAAFLALLGAALAVAARAAGVAAAGPRRSGSAQEALRDPAAVRRLPVGAARVQPAATRR